MWRTNWEEIYDLEAAGKFNIGTSSVFAHRGQTEGLIRVVFL